MLTFYIYYAILYIVFSKVKNQLIKNFIFNFSIALFSLPIDAGWKTSAVAVKTMVGFGVKKQARV
jgi:hypothetical protein